VQASGFEPCGVITLTTDFGHKGPFGATMKGVMLARLPSARIVDLTHETDVHFPAEAGFWLKRAYPYFPSGTVHVAVVDPGVGTQRDIVAFEHGGHAFIAPDNGLLAPIAESGPTTIHRLDDARLGKFGIDKVSATFHGRDIFAPLGAELAAGRVRPSDLGPVVDSIVPSWVDDPIVTATKVTGVVIALDNFGNLITNLDAALLSRFKHPTVQTGSHRFEVRRTYGDVKPGEYLALVNSFGVVEIARAEQSASDGLGLGRGAPVQLVEGR
jgi:S-adenosylmethionine hydrolase